MPRSLPTFVIMFAALLGATACAVTDDQLKALSAGHIGCEPEQIAVANRRVVEGVLLWNASCKEKSYLCSQVITGKSSNEYSCAPAQ
jgi:hypothetical protein